MRNSPYNLKPLWKILNEKNAAKILEQDIERQEEFCKKLAQKDAKTVALFETQWDNAIRINRKIDRLRSRTPEEIEADRNRNRRSVEEDRYQLEHERTDAQLIQDGRRRYLSDYGRKLEIWD